MTKGRSGKFGLFGGVICLLTYCSAVESSEESGYPEDWPELSRAAAPGCQAIEGRYHSQGYGSSTLSPNFEKPIFEQNFYGMEDIASSTNYFQVEIEKSQQDLRTQIFNKDGQLLANKHGGDRFSCFDGWVTLVSNTKGGSGESPHVSSRLETRLTKAVDGSLIVRSILKSKSRKFLFFSEEKESDIWYRYPPYK
jgi:hypothetical protein